MNAYELAIDRAENPFLFPDDNAKDFKKLAKAIQKQEKQIAELQQEVASLKQKLNLDKGTI
jgi:cell division protein FtsB